jgi:hypothetical protein
MNKEKTIELAESFLESEGIGYTRPGKVTEIEEGNVEVIFFVPEFFDKSAVIDPPDVRVKINLKSGKTSLVPQM